MPHRRVSDIFSETPVNWGLRGDPWLWEDFKRRFENTALPYPENSFVTDIYGFFESKTGEKLTREAQPYVDGYAHGGMSGGYVSGSFWIDQAIPLLLKRLAAANALNRREPAVFTYEKQARTGGIAMIAVSLLILMIVVISAALNSLSRSWLLLVLYALIIVPLLAFGIAQVSLHRGRITVSDGIIGFQRGGKNISVPYRDVRRIAFKHMFFQALILHTAQGSIRINKTIQGYQRLYQILSRHIPQLDTLQNGPVTLRAAVFSTYIAAAIVVLLLGAVLIFMIDGCSQGTIPLFSLLFMGSLSAFIIIFIVYSMLARPYKYRLGEDGVAECAFLKTKRHPPENISSIQYGQIRAKHHTRFRHSRMVSYITFKFTDSSSLTVNDLYTSYPIELAVQYAEKVFGIAPEYYDIEKQ